MLPAYSLILFTVASGAGYGLMVWLGLFAISGRLPSSPLVAIVTVGTALLLSTAGLLSATAHLGRPERAWRALSQWRSSWLSREGVSALGTSAAAVAFAAAWASGRAGLLLGVTASLMAAGAIATVCTTAMIYASLKPVREWHDRLTLLAYLGFALMTGAIVLNALLHLFAAGSAMVTLVALAWTLAAWSIKHATWVRQDGLGPPTTTEQATGLGPGRAYSLEWPHTAPNYLLKEMGYRVARRRRVRLRAIARTLAFAVPVALLLVSLLTGGLIGSVAGLACAPIAIAGVLIERWLFFAEATHTISAYYGLPDQN